MPSYNLGWLRCQGDQLYAYTHANSCIIDDVSRPAKTLADILDGFDIDEVLNAIDQLHAKVEDLENLVADMTENFGVSNVQAGVYACTEAKINFLRDEGKLDDNVMYCVVPNASSISRVVTVVHWLTHEGQLLDKAVYYGTIGDVEDIPFYGIKEYGGIGYRYTASGSPVKDRSTDAVSRQIDVPSSDTAETAAVTYTKNVVLELRAV